MVTHFQRKVEPNGFKAQVVVFDRECCVLYKQVMDELMDPEASAIVMTTAPGDPSECKQHERDKDAEEKLLNRFRGQGAREAGWLLRRDGRAYGSTRSISMILATRRDDCASEAERTIRSVKAKE